MKYNNSKSGFLRLIVLFAIFIALVTYFNINVVDVVESRPVQVVWGWAQFVWESFLQPAVSWLWDGTQKFFDGLDTPSRESVGDIATTTPAEVATTTEQ